MLVLVGPSASGKTEVANILINNYGMVRMVTYTTRPMRVNEINGVSYHFVSVEEFMKLKDNDEFVETVEYNGNYYGTRKSDVEIDKIVILEPKGLHEFNNKMSDKIVSFYLEVSEVERINRMIYRQDKMEDIKKRIENDKEAFKDIDEVDFVISNEHITISELADRIYKLYKKRIRRKIK